MLFSHVPTTQWHLVFSALQFVYNYYYDYIFVNSLFPCHSPPLSSSCLFLSSSFSASLSPCLFSDFFINISLLLSISSLASFFSPTHPLPLPLCCSRHLCSPPLFFFFLSLGSWLRDALLSMAAPSSKRVSNC